MARVMTPDQFQKCRPGTVFAYGERWALSRLLILRSVHVGRDYWCFQAVDPAWVDTPDGGDPFSALEDMAETGASRPAETASTRYASFDGDAMDVFFVLERSDWDAICSEVTFPDDAKEV